mgnify:CR=1 FL=1
MKSKATPASKPAPVSKAAAPAEDQAEESAAPVVSAEAAEGLPPLAEDEEIRICEWEKCNKAFVVKASGRTAVRRFCSGTCRGRASEARTGKR